MSRRFGNEDKLLADLKGQALLAYCLDTAASAPFTDRFIVTFDDERALLGLARGFNIIHNPDPELGMGAALAGGVRHILQLGHSQACILLGDMPFVTTHYLQNLMKRSSQYDITYSQNNERDMPPAIFKGAALKVLTQLTGDKGAQSLDLSGFKIDHLQLPDEMARDMDEPNDFDHANNI